MDGFQAQLDSSHFIYVIPGIPIPLQRHRHNNVGNTWDAQKQNKVRTGIEIQAQHAHRRFYEGPLHMDIRFYFPIPLRGKRSTESWSNRKHCIKPDISNCIKYIEDVCSKLIFYDDCLIASIYSEKLYDYEPRTEFYIIELK